MSKEMKNPFTLSVSLMIYAFFSQVTLEASAYVPIRDRLEQGSYRSSNYLETVSDCLGTVSQQIDQAEIYNLFGQSINENYSPTADKLGKDKTLVKVLSRKAKQRPMLIGRYAEERFVKVNSHAGWKKVKDRFATQRDVFRIINGRREYGQIKVHGLGKSAKTMRDLASRYIKSMRKDSGRGQASQFLVPDDHYPGIQTKIDEDLAEAVKLGKTAEVAWLRKQKIRLSKLGVSYAQLSSEADSTHKFARKLNFTKQVGSIIAVSHLLTESGAKFYDWSNGKLNNSGLVMSLGKTGSTCVVGSATTELIKQSKWLRSSPLRSSMLIGAAMFLVDEAWLIKSCGGWANAFSSPGFYVQSGGNFGGVMLGSLMAVGGAELGMAMGSVFGPPGSVIGAIVVGGVGYGIGSFVGYLGCSRLTEWCLKTFNSKFYYGMKMRAVDKAEEKIVGELESLEKYKPAPLLPISCSPKNTRSYSLAS